MANIFPKSSLGDSKYIASRWTYAHWTEWMFQTFPLVTYSQAQNGPCQVWRSGWARRIVVTCIWHGVDRKWRCRSLDNIRGQAYSGLEATRKQLPDMTKGRQLKEYMVCGGDWGNEGGGGGNKEEKGIWARREATRDIPDTPTALSHSLHAHDPATLYADFHSTWKSKFIFKLKNVQNIGLHEFQIQSDAKTQSLLQSCNSYYSIKQKWKGKVWNRSPKRQ